MLKIFLGNVAILAAAFLYWFLIDYMYAKNFEVYRSIEWILQLSFLVFALISYDYSYKRTAFLSRKRRRAISLLIPVLLGAIYLLVLYFYGIDFHVWVGYLLYS